MLLKWWKIDKKILKCCENSDVKNIENVIKMTKNSFKTFRQKVCKNHWLML